MTRLTVPWSEAEARSSFVFTATGIALIVWGWWGASGSVSPDGTPWFACGIAGLGVLCFGMLVWVTAGRRAVRERQEALEERVLTALQASTALCREPSALLVALPGSTRYHRAECLLVAGKPTAAYGGSDAELRPLHACEMCRP